MSDPVEQLQEFFEDLERQGLVKTIDLSPAGFDSDGTALIRQELVIDVNSRPTAGDSVPKDEARLALEAQHGQVWDTDELSRDYEVTGFAAPFVVARRKADGVRGTLTFQHYPRFYWGFEPA
jgi:hypothetical protein